MRSAWSTELLSLQARLHRETLSSEKRILNQASRMSYHWIAIASAVSMWFSDAIYKGSEVRTSGHKEQKMAYGHGHANPITDEEFHSERLCLLKIPQTPQGKPSRRDKSSNTSSYLWAFHSTNFILTLVTMGSLTSHDENEFNIMSMIVRVCNSL